MAEGEQVAKVQLAVAGVSLDASGTSTQADQEDNWTPEGAIAPPLSPDHLAGLTKVSRLRRSCIAAIAHNTVGLGYELGVREGHEEELEGDPAEVAREARAALDALAARDEMLKRPSFGRQVTTVVWDKYEVGSGYLEVARNRVTGRISGLFHAPGKRLRRLKERDGWVMLNKAGGSMGDGVRFYDFGKKVAYDDGGGPQPRLASSGMRWDVNEVIPFQLYTSESRDYGLPPDAALAGDYLGDKLAGDTNISFFGSSGVPPTVMFVRGEESQKGDVLQIEVPPKFIQQVQDALRGGPHSRGRVAIIGVPAGFEAQVENLAVTSERDMGFIAYRGDNRRATLGAFRLSPIFVADIEDAGKYTAEVERAITKEQVFDPEQREDEEVLNGTIMRELFPHLEISFAELAIKGDEANRESADSLADRGSLTRRELRAAHGYGPLPEAKENEDPKIGEVAYGWNDELVRARAPAAPLPARPEDPAERPPIAKAADLETEIRADFDAAIDDAIRQVHDFNPDARARAILVEKDGDSIVVRARENGAPA